MADVRARDDLFTLHGSVRHSPLVDAWLERRTGPLGEIARRWFGVIRSCGSDVSELLHDGCPTACVGDAAFAYVNVYKAHVNVGFFRGASLADPAKLLTGTGKAMRHVKLAPGTPVDETALEALVRVAHADIRRHGVVDTRRT